MYRLNDTTALIQTVDFFTPIVDDPYSFGQIAAANALSDVYAMGGTPLLCMNILACPVKTMDNGVFQEVVKGGLDKVKEAGALLVGGHSVEDQELKYGLSVTGIVHPERVLLNSGARAGDVLVLTKPLGTGILSTAVKGGLGNPRMEQQLVETMGLLNKLPMELLDMLEPGSRWHGVHGCTDITGFGLFGHLYEMAEASGVTIHLNAAQFPVLPDVIALADMGIIPEGAYTNQKFYCQWLQGDFDPLDSLLMVGYDPQTSGGLLLAMDVELAGQFLQRLQQTDGAPPCAIIGEVKEREAASIVVRRG